VCYFSPKWAKTHLRASVVQKNFLGSLSLAIREGRKGKGEEGRGGEGGGEEREGGEGKGGRGKGKGHPQFQQQIYAPGLNLFCLICELPIFSFDLLYFIRY
jgi:hypothetical protein